MNVMPHLVAWSVLVTVVVLLVIYRFMLTRREDETLHVSDDAAVVTSHQLVLAKKLEVLDRWGKLLTVLAVLYGLAIAGMHLYNVWLAGPGGA